MKRLLMLIICLQLWSVGFSQVVMRIKCIHVGYNVYDSNKTYGFQTNLLFENPRIKLDVVVENNTSDSVKFNTEYSTLSGRIQYKYEAETISMANAGWMSSDEEIPFFFENIPPGGSYNFSLSFELQPSESFTIDTYRENVWSIIPTLEVTITQEKPHPLVLKSEPVDWQNFTICNDKQPE